MGQLVQLLLEAARPAAYLGECLDVREGRRQLALGPTQFVPAPPQLCCGAVADLLQLLESVLQAEHAITGTGLVAAPIKNCLGTSGWCSAQRQPRGLYIVSSHCREQAAVKAAWSPLILAAVDINPGSEA